MSDGGSAFPYHREWTNERKGYTESESADGMSLRDYLAAHAIAVVLSTESFTKGESSLRIDAARCYRFADAMLAERAK